MITVFKPASARLFAVLVFMALTSGCTTYGKIGNLSKSQRSEAIDYSISLAANSATSREVTLVVAFSGGGTRAAALAYGVLQALRDVEIIIDGQYLRLIDEIDLISSVSGGSFTAAYYGLFGERIFSDFEDDFLHRDVTGELLSGLFNPGLWFSSHGRTEMAVDFYEEKVFKGATFADLYASDGPVIVINATDLGRGVRFSFLQDYFDLLCSDLSSFQVARAVTASSAVPVLFNPVVLKNHSDCNNAHNMLLQQARQNFKDSPQLEAVVDGLSSYADKQRRQFIHLVDGGITDNLGLQSIYEAIELAGGAKRFLSGFKVKPARYLVVVSVNASTSPQYQMESTNRVPSLEETINAMSDTQLHRTNTSTLEQFAAAMQRWSNELSSNDFKVNQYLVEIDFNRITQAERRLFFNQIPVSLSLPRHEVRELIQAGRELLLDNADFQRFIDDFSAGSK